ncbi:MAG: class II aldolase/adducin family protein, partial [Pseudomonadota bacterium]
MASTLDDLPPRAALVEIARDFHARGWMAGTAGNLSAREDDGHFWITASGKPKGRLDENDFLLVRVKDGAVVEKRVATDKPSAETTIHAALYRRFPEARAVLHGHSVEAMLAASRT